jgi:hypothetical protein
MTYLVTETKHFKTFILNNVYQIHPLIMITYLLFPGTLTLHRGSGGDIHKTAFCKTRFVH